MPYELNEDPPIDPVYENVLVIPQDLVSEYKQGEIYKPQYHTKHGHNHLLYGLAVDWGDRIPASFKRLERRDYEKACQSLWSLDRIAEPLETVVGFSQGRMKPLRGLKTEKNFALVKVQNILLTFDYDAHDFEDTKDVGNYDDAPDNGDFSVTA